MTDVPAPTDDAEQNESRIEDRCGGVPDSPTLRHKTACQSDGTTRCTVYPEGTSGVERMSIWLSVDDSITVSLDRIR